MYILELSDFWLNIGEALNQFVENIGGWNWNNILEYFKNISLGTVALTILTLTVKVGLPLLRNSNKLILKKFAELYENVSDLKKENQTVSNILKQWVVLQSDINKYSKTLKPEHKKAFSDLAEAMRMVEDNNVQEAANKIDEIIEDNKVDVNEMQDLVESTDLGKQVLGTNINDIIPKSDSNEQ